MISFNWENIRYFDLKYSHQCVKMITNIGFQENNCDNLSFYHALAAWSSSIVSACHWGDWSYWSWDRIPPGYSFLTNHYIYRNFDPRIWISANDASESVGITSASGIGRPGFESRQGIRFKGNIHSSVVAYKMTLYALFVRWNGEIKALATN
jgi:hypothetical protein